MSIIDPQRLAWLGGKQLVELSREAGIDPTLLARHPGIVIQQRLGPTAKKKRLTFGTARGRWGSPPPTPESLDAVREMDLDAEQQREFRRTTDFGVFLYNRYFESAIGRNRPLKSKWFRSIPWRATAVVPAGDHFMEYYAHAVAMFDPSFVAIGGFTNGTVGHESRVARFARVFRQLPVGTWQEIAGLANGVVGRSIHVGGKRYVYVVSKSCRHARVALRGTRVMRPIGGSPRLVAGNDGMAVTLAPYQLAAWVEERGRTEDGKELPGR